ncbi:DUF6527 family protein [Pseudomonas cavernicola]|uniref:DUF6527 family protein n=1 Tax=Pseudomonas cavernicola TaxID=2320866 RepID=UPI0030831A18
MFRQDQDGALPIRAGWGWNGNADRPTFTPSILVNQGRACPEAHVGHLFVTDGRIQLPPRSRRPDR